MFFRGAVAADAELQAKRMQVCAAIAKIEVRYRHIFADLHENMCQREHMCKRNNVTRDCLRICRVGQICVCIYAQLWLKFASLKTHKNSAPSPFAVRCCGLCNFARAAFELIVVFVEVVVRVFFCVFYVGRRAICVVVVLMVVLVSVRLREGVCVRVFVRMRVSV